ncbi:MAG: DNA-processing protein DprA, partial [Candidatus Brocadiae bacterium]|nr:DNA-processing protein DprA [Candidatus Brocadiia bacterium]
QLAVAVVGSRHCSTYGRQQASRLAADLAGMGFTIVSGMAYGIDSAAHRGALTARGRTLAVLGCGLAKAPSPGDEELALDIAENGALLSELPMEAPPRPGNFPPRNRLISGLSLGVVVVEAAGRSGALITARLAGEQGKAVFAVPGNVDSPTSRGCHQLIRDGAVLVENARDVVDGLGPLSAPIELAGRAHEGPARPVEDARVMALNERERSILDLVGPSPRHIDEIVTETQLAPSIVSSTLLTLEIRGLIQQLAGQRYVRS